MDAGREDARLLGLRAELAAARERAEKAILFYEIAVHLEDTTRDLEGARDHYRLAVSTDPSFRPAIFALRRLLAAQPNVEPARLAELCAAEERASKAPHDVASALLDHAVVLEDRAQKPAQARPLFERALRTEPENAAAALMLELYLARHGDAKAMGRLATERAAATKDPVLKQVLTLESAEHKLKDGDREGAIALLREAASAPAERLRVLRALLRIGADQTDVVLETLDKLALFASDAGKNEGPLASPSVGALPPFRDGHAARAWAKVYLWDGARIRIERAGEVQTALRALDRAIALDPDDLAIRLERLDLLERGSDVAAAADEASAIASRLGKGPRAAVAHLRVASLAHRAGDAKRRRAAVEAAFSADPSSPLTSAELANVFASEGRHHQRIEWLERAASSGGRGRSGRAYFEAAHLAAAEEKNFARARRLYVNALERGENAATVRRELYGAALLLAPDEAGLFASELAAESIDAGERSALRFEALLRARSKDGGETIRILETELARSDEEGSRWAPHAARIIGARETRPDISVRAHRALANEGTDVERAGHLAALARIHVKKGDLEAASNALDELLARVPSHAYARALREEIVRKTRGAPALAELLHESGKVEENERVAEILLLRAAIIARADGRTDLAAKACATAMERRPSSIGPRWLAVQVASETRDRAALREALTGISEMRGALAARASLSLAEERAVDGAGGEAFEALLDDESVGTAAALWLVVTSTDRERVISALEKLCSASAGTSAAAFFTRALAVFTFGKRAPEASKAVIDRVLRQRGDDPYCRLLALESAGVDRSKAPERRDALIALARATRDEKLHADLALEAALVDLASGSGRAQELLSEIPSESGAHAFVLDEIGEQASNAARRLSARLAHASDAAKPAISSALGRALLSVGRAPEAVELLLGVVAAEPHDLSAWITLRYAARLTALPDVFVRATLTLAEHLPVKRKAALLEEAGVTLLEALEEPHEAEAVLAKALAADPARLATFARLKRIYQGRGDTEALSKLVSVRVNEADDPAELAALLLEEARIHREARRFDRALDSLKNLRVLEPAHVPGTALLADLYFATERYEQGVDTLRELACLDLPPELRSSARFAAARFLQEKLSDPARAFEELAIVERMGFLDEALAARMAQLAELAGRNDDAVRYLALAAELAKAGSKAGYERRAAALHRLERDDRAGAVDAYWRALEASPGDPEALAGISSLVDRAERRRLGTTMIEALLRGLARGPVTEDALRRLRRAAEFSEERDLEWLSLSVLAALGLAKDDEVEALESLGSSAPARLRGFLTDEATSLLVDAADRGPLRELAALATDAVLALEGRDATSRGAERTETPPAAFVEIAEIAAAFGSPVREVATGAEEDVDLVSGDEMRWLVPEALEILGPHERFAVGVLSFASRTGSIALALRPHADGATLLYAIASASGHALPDSPDDAAEIAAPLREHLDQATAKQIAWIAAQMDPAEDPGAFAHAVEQTLLRAGLVACRDLRVVLEFALGSGPTIEAVQGRAVARDLVRFWLSDAHRSIRRDLALDLPPTPEVTEGESIAPPVVGSRSGFFADVEAPVEWDVSLDALVEAALSFAPKTGEHPSVERPASAEIDDRRDLVRELEPHARGPYLARLLALDAELSEQANELGASEKSLTRAHRAHPDDVVVLRRLRRLRHKAGAHAEAVKLLEHEASLALTNDDRAFALSYAAAIAAMSDPRAAEGLVQRALAQRPRSAALSLVLASLQRLRGAEQEHAESLERAARDLHDGACASVLLAEAGFANERASDPARARFLFRRATELDPANVEATLGLARAGIAHGVFEDAFKPLASLADAFRDPSLADSMRRVAATLALGWAGRAEQAVRIVADATDPIALDVKVAAATAAGDNDALGSALEALARSGRRTERALALVRLAEMHLASGDERSVAETLREAASADPTVTVIRALQVEAARKRDDFRTLYRLLRAEGFTPLDGAARALVSANADGVERQLLAEAAAEPDLCAAILLLDAAKTPADVQRAIVLELGARQERESLAIAAVLVVHELEDERESERFARELRELVPNDATIVRVLAAMTTGTDPARAAPLWLRDAELATGERAAFAATLAGRLFEKSEGDAASAYDRALTLDRRYGPAMWSLEAHARRVRDLRTLRAVLGRAANREGEPDEVAERSIRAALVEDELPLDLVARASDAMPEDGCIADLVFRVGGSRIAAHARAELLERQASDESPAWTRAVRLRQATILEEAGDFAAAASACRAVLRTHPDDPFASYLLDRYEPRAGEGDHMDARLRQAVDRAGDDVARGLALEALGEFFGARDDRRRDAADAYRAILEKFPSHGPSLRALERLSMSFDDDLALARHEEAYAKSASPDAALAHTRLALRLYARAGAVRERSALLASVFDFAEIDGWLAREVEASARESGDQRRLVRALEEEIELLQGSERVAIELRAAESVREARAPSIAVHRIERLTHQSTSYPVLDETLARFRRASGAHAKAAESFLLAAKRARSAEWKSALYFEAGALLADEVHDNEAAAEAFLQAAQAHPAAHRALERLVDLSSNPVVVQRVAEIVVKQAAKGLDREGALALYDRLARHQSKLGDPAGAKKTLRRAMSLDAGNPRLLEHLFSICEAEADWAGAAEALDRWARASKEAAVQRTCYLRLADVLERARDLRKAEAAVQKALALGPEDPIAQKRLAEIQRQLVR